MTPASVSQLPLVGGGPPVPGDPVGREPSVVEAVDPGTVAARAEVVVEVEPPVPLVGDDVFPVFVEVLVVRVVPVVVEVVVVPVVVPVVVVPVVVVPVVVVWKLSVTVVEHVTLLPPP